jgi:glycosyltransferase involved in cell wall biosynthesis
MVHVVYNGIDVMRFRFTDEDALSIRNSLGLNGVPVVGVFSRLARWKGQHILLEALPALPKVHAVFVGEAIFPRDKTYLGELLKTVARLRLEDRVHFLGFREDVPRLLRMCDVVAHTSTAPEPFGRVIVEGMLAGRPVIATRGGGATEIIEHRRTGLLVNPGDVPALVEAISWSLAAREQANEMARRGREAAQQRFSLEAMMGNVEYHIGEVTRDVKRIPLRLS